MIKIKYSNQTFMCWNANDVIHLRKNHRIIGNLIGALPDHPRQNESNGLPLVLMSEEVRLLHSLNYIQIVATQFNDSEDAKLKEFDRELNQQFHEEIRQKLYQEKCQQITSNLDKIIDGKLKKFPELKNLQGIELENFRQKTHDELLANVRLAPNPSDLTRFYIASPYDSIKIEKIIQLEPLEPYSMESLKYLTYKHFWSKGYYLTDGIKFGAHFLAYDHDPLMFHAKFIIVCCHTQQDLDHFQQKMTQAFGRLGKNVRKNVIVVHFVVYSENIDQNHHQEKIQLQHIQWNPMIYIEEKIP